jgi:hypothetical protein
MLRRISTAVHYDALVMSTTNIDLASLALLWRPAAHSAERPLRVAIAALLPAMIWGSFFLALLVPGRRRGRTARRVRSRSRRT